MAERGLEFRYLSLSAKFSTKLLMQALPSHWLPSSVLPVFITAVSVKPEMKTFSTQHFFLLFISKFKLSFSFYSLVPTLQIKEVVRTRGYVEQQTMAR